MTTCAYCGREGSSDNAIYCFGDGEPICHQCHVALPNTIAACRHEIVKLRKALAGRTGLLAEALDAVDRDTTAWNKIRAELEQSKW